MPFTTTFKNSMLNLAIPGNTVYASLHTAAPSQGTPNEVTGGAPAYARQPITLAVASSGARAASGAAPFATFNVPPGTTVTHIGYWDALSVGTGNLLAFYDINPDEVFNNQGKADLNSVTFSLQDVVGG